MKLSCVKKKTWHKVGTLHKGFLFGQISCDLFGSGLVTLKVLTGLREQLGEKHLDTLTGNLGSCFTDLVVHWNRRVPP